MKTSIATVSISGDLKEKLAAIAAAGFDGVEIFENDFLAFDGSPAEVGSMIRDYGLEITLFQPFRDFEGMPEPQRSRAFDRAERKFDLMQDLGTDLMLICSNVSPASLGGIDRAAADLQELGGRAAKRGLRVGYEALAWGRHISDHRDAWEIVRRAAHPNVGLILDSFHTLARKIDVASIRAIPGDRIFIVQLADAPLIDMDLLYWSRHFRNMPGEGDLAVVDFMRAVAATGYDGPLSLEIFNDQFRGGSPKSIAIDGRRSLVYLMDQVKRGEPALSIAVPDMPDRISVEGFEFVEFAADESEAQELARLLTAMGFTEAARHKNKDVTLFRQGGINIVINTEKEGLAHSSYIAHGTSAYAIGLRVEDASATVIRARALGAEIFEQRPGPGELAIPAIRGIGGAANAPFRIAAQKREIRPAGIPRR
jgi:4-hydroxyphenylpyruvate dioxygenase